MDELVQELVPDIPKARIRTLSCGHIIPDANLMAWPVSHAVDSLPLDFTFEKRGTPATLASLGKSIIALARVIPHGVVVFFPSYGYLEQAIRAWKSSTSEMWSQLTACKEVFTDSKETAKVDDILRTYSEAVFRGNGALLFSVVGGKMSEGINFSDELGRGVIVIGLPFPNASSIEWKMKTQYIQQRTVARGGTEAEGAAAARSVYENSCMRAVNQSIGRAIRHRKDYATIFMLDRRYATPRIQSKLPGWIKKQVAAPVEASGFDKMIDSVRDFFAQPRGG